MAYPTSVKTFTTKTSGQSIEAVDVNDLQTEINAVEEGLLNGLSHDLTPSTNSTRALGTSAKRWRAVQATTIACDRLNSTSLDVTGGSTLATLNVTGGSTLGTATLGASTLASLEVTRESTFSTITITGDVSCTGTVGSSSARVKTLWVATLNATAGGGVTPKSLCDGRLTATTAVPVTTADVTGATSIFYTPYSGNHIALYDGSAAWTALTFTEITISLSGLTASKPYDIFAFDNSGTVTIETLVWTNDTTRATALVLQDGVLVKSGATTRRFLGTIYINSSGGQTDDSYLKRNINNYYNRVDRPMRRLETTATWAYSTATIRQANGATANQLEMVSCFNEDQVDSHVTATSANGTAGNGAGVGIGLDSTSAHATGLLQGHNVTSVANHLVDHTADLTTFIGIGRHTLVWLEQPDGNGTQTWRGVTGSSQENQSGIMGTIRG